MSKKIVYEDDSVKTRDTTENFSYFFTILANFVQKVLTYFILYYYVLDENGFTYFKRGGNNCQLYYDYSVNRWIALAFAIANLVDQFVCNNAGREFGNLFGIITGMIASVTNIVLVFMYYFYNATFCNTDGINVLGNVCRSREFCGVQGLLNNTLNQCSLINPYLLPLQSGVTADELKWNSWFSWFFGILIAMSLISILKTVAQFFIPSLTGENKIKQTILKAIRSNEKIDSSFVGRTAEKLLKSKDRAQNNLFTLKTSFFTFLSIFEDGLYFVVMFFNFVALIFIIVWSGWFMQNAQKAVWRYKLTDPFDGTTTIFRYVDFQNYVFYAILGLNAILTSFNVHLADNFSNVVTMFTSFIGLVLNTGLWVFSLLFYAVLCNDPLYGYNICSDRCLFCSINYVFQNNFCINTAGCTSPYKCVTNSWKWDFDFVILMIFLTYWIFSNLLTLVATLIFHRRFKKIEQMVKDYNESRIKKLIAGRMEDVECEKNKIILELIEYFKKYNLNSRWIVFVDMLH